MLEIFDKFPWLYELEQSCSDRKSKYFGKWTVCLDEVKERIDVDKIGIVTHVALMSRIGFYYERLSRLHEAKNEAIKAIELALPLSEQSSALFKFLPRLYYGRARIGGKLIPKPQNDEDVVDPFPISKEHKLELETSLTAANQAIKVHHPSFLPSFLH